MFYFFGKSVRKVRAFGSGQIIAEVIPKMVVS